MHAFTYTPCEAVRRLHLAYFPAFHAPSRAPTPPRGAIDPKPLSLSLSLTFAITTVERQRFLAARDGDASLAAELLRKHLAWLGLGSGLGIGLGPVLGLGLGLGLGLSPGAPSTWPHLPHTWPHRMAH